MVNRYLQSLVYALFVCITRNAYAEYSQTAKLIYTHLSYKEYQNSTEILEDSGALVGIGYNIEFLSNNRLGLDKEIDFSFSRGMNVDYFSPESGQMKNISYYVLEGTSKLKLPISFKWVDRFSPYIGLGYRGTINDDTGRFSSYGHYGYYRGIHYFYLPLGLTVNTNWHNYNIKATIEYSNLIRGKVVTRVIRAVTFSQENGFGTKGKLELQKKSFSGINYQFGIFAYTWSIGDSDAKQVELLGGGAPYMYEPANTTSEIGLSFEVSF